MTQHQSDEFVKQRIHQHGNVPAVCHRPVGWFNPSVTVVSDWLFAIRDLEVLFWPLIQLLGV